MKTQKSNGSNERKVKSDQRGKNVKCGRYGRGWERLKKQIKKSELGRGNSTNIPGQAVGGNIEVLANG